MTLEEGVFTCCECLRDVYCAIPREIPLCALCQFYPHWYAVRQLREILDPEYLPRLAPPPVDHRPGGGAHG